MGDGTDNKRRWYSEIVCEVPGIQSSGFAATQIARVQDFEMLPIRTYVFEFRNKAGTIINYLI